MDLEQIKKIVAYMEESSLSKIRFKDKDVEIELERESGQISSPQPQPQPVHYQPEPVKAEGPKKVEKGHTITSPMVGTYYSSPAPDQPQFVKVGDRIEEGSVVCIIEAMKVMNEVKADKSGTIKEILINNADPVEFGTPIITLEPA
ncbi:MAG: acetyl-CoA carboxylase biotin carboxyl carrier protein [Chlamydiales bacterium]